MVGRGFVAPLLLLSACNWLLGIDEVVPVDDMNRDTDGDGIPDIADNCPLVANPDQLDSDGDHRGDACDACPDSATDRDGDGMQDACDLCPDVRSNGHDEDGDGVGDECDLCPIDFDAGDTDTDGDGIGDLCDRASTAQQRVLFDAFAPFIINDPNWVIVGPTAWVPSGDHDGVQPVAAALPPAELDAEVALGNTADWFLAVDLTIPTSMKNGDTIGIGIGSGSPSQICQVQCSATGCFLQGVFSTSTTNVVPGSYRLTLHVADKQGTVRTTCELRGPVNDTLVAQVANSAGHPMLYSTVVTEFTHVFAVD